MLKNITKNEFENEVLNSSLPVLVDFYSETCMPCRMLAPVLADVANDYSHKVKTIKVNVFEEGELADKYGVTAVPTVVFIKNGQETERIVGLADKQEYVSIINRL